MIVTARQVKDVFCGDAEPTPTKSASWKVAKRELDGAWTLFYRVPNEGWVQVALRWPGLDEYDGVRFVVGKRHTGVPVNAFRHLRQRLWGMGQTRRRVSFSDWGGRTDHAVWSMAVLGLRSTA